MIYPSKAPECKIETESENRIWWVMNVMYSKFIRRDLNKFRQGGKSLKLQLCRHFLVEALLVIEPPNIVPPSENAVGTAVILDFFITSILLMISWLQ